MRSSQQSSSKDGVVAHGQAITTQDGYEDSEEQVKQRMDADSADLDRDEDRPYSTEGKYDPMHHTANQEFYNTNTKLSSGAK